MLTECTLNVKSETKLLCITKFLWGYECASLCCNNGQKKIELKLINRFQCNKTLSKQSGLIHREQTGSQDIGLIFSTTHSPFCKYEKVNLNALPSPYIKQQPPDIFEIFQKKSRYIAITSFKKYFESFRSIEISLKCVIYK